MLESADRQRVLEAINAIAAPVTIIDVVGPGEFAIFAVNRSTEECTGLANSDIAGHLLHYLVDDELATRLIGHYQRCVDDRSPVEFDEEHFSQDVDARARTKLVPIFGRDDAVVRIVGTTFRLSGLDDGDDGSDDGKGGDQDNDADVERAVTRAEERERHRIADDLHSGAMQRLGLASLELGALKEQLSDRNARALVDRIVVLIDDTLRDTQDFLRELSPAILSDLGFEAAVRWLARRMEEQHGIACQIHDDLQPKPLDSDMSVLMFQAVRELLRNVRKHADARKVEITIRRIGDAVVVEAEDDGVGFADDCDADGPAAAGVSVLARADDGADAESASDVHATGGFGLSSLRDRLDAVGGRLTIESMPVAGTRVTVVAPLTWRRKVA